jgi:flagellar motility protein MotE (MotC chaperone)
MNRYVQWSVLGGGALLFFGAAYVGFALALGGSLDDVLHKDAKTSAPSEQHAPAPTQHTEPPRHEPPAPTPSPAHVSTASLLDVFQLQSPYSGAELEELASELKLKNKEYDRRLAELVEREQRAERRSEQLDQRLAELQELRKELEARESELELRRVEVERDEAAKAQRDEVGWAKLAKLFAEGDATEQGKKLAGYPAEDAARILDQLKPARAKALLDHVGADKWKEYADAYRKLVEPSSK